MDGVGKPVCEPPEIKLFDFPGVSEAADSQRHHPRRVALQRAAEAHQRRHRRRARARRVAVAMDRAACNRLRWISVAHPRLL